MGKWTLQCVQRASVACALLLCVLFIGQAQGQRSDDDLSGLFPVVFNLATRARIQANATCGLNEPEVFCKLVEHVRIFPAENRHCDICDARSDNQAQSHPIQYAIDGSQKWWQSPTLTNGAGFNHVSIILDLGQIYQIAYIIIKAANSPRPGNWILERSLDGETYFPWQYFAMTDKECRMFYGIEATRGVPTFLRDDQVICTSRYSALNPLENGEIFVSLVNGRPGVFQPSKVLLDFTSARYVRLRFQKIRTLNADLMSFSSIDPDSADASVTRRYYYSVKDISIGGQCICYGHATFCRRHDTLEDRLQCQCLHNTAGDNCEMCLPKFNQKPWKVGGIQGLGCEECNCHGKSDECVYNATVGANRLSLNMTGSYDGGGVCLNCREYTTGVNCERCLPGYYRPRGMTPDMRFPCRQCNCQETQTSTSECVLDDSRVDEGLEPGSCICKEGYSGPGCDRCAFGYFGYPNCRPCRCNAAGSRDPDNCDRACVCKVHVRGSRCDSCEPGYFNLEQANPEGCTKCFCFGVSTVCESVSWGLSRVDDYSGWVLSTLGPGGLTLLPRMFGGWLEAKTYLLKVDAIDPRSYSQDDIHYWVAPMSYLGNRLSSYGGYLTFTLKYSLDDQLSGGYHLREPNLVLEGSNLAITTDKEYLREEMENKVRIRLHESGWFRLSDRQPVTRDEMMTVLYSLSRLLIRATYHTAQETVFLKNVYMDMASPLVMDGSSLPSVEQCRCPQGYAGLSCESCSPGWRRVENQLYGGRCQQCQCYGHASGCDPVTGDCMDCRHSTAGARCDRCLPGFYGDPRRGSPDDCKPCACPLTTGNNFFAERCVARPTLEDRDAYECVNCQEGYTGARCEMCASGYYGNPGTPGGSCRRCMCGGNIDMSLPGSCNNVTGACTRCATNTEGEFCERCSPGYYGSAVNGDCRPCECSNSGSRNNECNARSGQCECKERFTGRRCNKCERGYGNVERGCERCSCDRQGSQSSECDPVSGQCRCVDGVVGLNCDACAEGYYDFSRRGCKDCDCYGPGTNNTVTCDPYSGRCQCRPGVMGRQCDSCKRFHYGLESGEGCKDCACDRTGARSGVCDPQNGQCECRPGVMGRTCDKCQPGFYGFSRRGCEACEPCNKPGHICNPDTGKCECPPNTEGPNCEVCIRDCWGFTKDQGCKENVEGLRCDRCRPGTFSLDGNNPKGCTECYCFLRAQQCMQAPYVWKEIDLPSMSAEFVPPGAGGEPPFKRFGYHVINSTKTEVTSELSSSPLYFALLSDALPSDMTLNYGGKLQITHYFEGPSEYLRPEDAAPLAVMVGNGIQIVSQVSNLEPLNPVPFEVVLHEDMWQLPGQVTPITRRLMMVVLEKVQGLFVRAVQNGRAQYSEVGPIMIERAVPPASAPPNARPALGVETCDCPDRYSGDSCQNPGPGYFRVVPDGTTNIGVPETVIGQVKPCQCYRHSEFCDAETGQCLACEHNTTGRQCELCADGYYGVATRGTPDDCQPCACPLPIPSNNFSPSCVGGRNGMMCTACIEGYTGLRCENCAPGYYGNPQTVGSKCLPCNCNPQGSQGGDCDVLTGQCPCLPGIEGLSCEACSDPTYGVQDGQCISCYEGCTGILLKDMEELAASLVNINFTGAVYPWDRLNELSDEGKALSESLRALEAAGSDNLKDMKESADTYNQIADKLIHRSNTTCEGELSTTGGIACRTQKSAEQVKNNATDLEKVIDQLFKDIKKSVDELNKLINDSLAGQGGTGGQLDEQLKKAQKILDEILDRDFSVADAATQTENMRAEKLSESIQDLIARNFNVSMVEEDLNDVKDRLNDLINQTKGASATADNALELIRNLTDLLNEMKRIKEEIDKLRNDSEDYIDDAWDLIYKADSSLLISTGENDLLARAIDDLYKRVTGLREAMPRLQDLYQRAVQHALYLRGQTEEMKRLFAKTRDLAKDAVTAAKAYQSIVDAIAEAKKSAEKALQDAEESKKIAQLSDLKKEVDELMRISNQQLREADSLLAEAKGLLESLGDVKDDLTEAGEKHGNAKEILEEIKKKLKLLPENFRDSLDSIEKRTKAAEKTAEDAIELINKLNTTALMEKMNEMKNLDLSAFRFDIGSEIERVKDAGKDIKKLTDREKDVDDKASAAARKVSNVHDDLEKLRAKIINARNRVNDMKMSLQADGQCYRSYPSSLTPSSTNELRFGFKLDEAPNSDMLMVLLLQSPQEFLAAEIKDGKVRFSWESGKGLGSVSHGRSLEPQKWYKVVAKRVGSIGQLKVWSLEESTEKRTNEEVASAGAGCSLLNLNEDSSVFLAGTSNLHPIPAGITRKNFVGCLGEVSIDNSKLGVYNFKTNEPEHCTACKQIPLVELGDGKTYVFNGRGFARFEVLGGYSSSRTKVELEFKTFWENSTIFFVGNEELGDFCSIELVNGRVQVKFNMGGNSKGSGITANTYNSNQWTKVTFDRKKLQAVLIVNSEKIPMSASGPNSGLDLQGAPMYYGGLPTTFSLSKFQGLTQTRFFYGCMKGLTFGSLPPEDDTSVFVNVQTSSGCRENGIHTVGFRGDGYLTLKSEYIGFNKQKNDISLTFVTKEKDAVILIARDIPGENYYSIALVDGRMEARIRSDGNQPVGIQAKERFNDGVMHCVSLIKDGKIIKLVVDDKVLGTDSALDVSFFNGGDLYLGGSPIDVDDIAPTSIKLDGCISDVIANGKLLSMSDAKQYMRADVGRCHLTTNMNEPVVVPKVDEAEEEPTEEPTIPTSSNLSGNTPVSPTSAPTSCASEGNPAQEDDAKSVANGATFFAEISKVKKKELARRFDFTFDFRTYYADGLFGYLTNADKSFYFGIQLRDGKLEVSYVYLGQPMVLRYNELLNDGKWHSVEVKKKGESVSVSYDGKTAKSDLIDQRLDIKLPLRLGGPAKPEDFTDYNVDLVTHSIRGCIRSLKVSGRGVNITDTQVIQDVGGCYKNVEAGAYFGGDAFGVITDDFDVPKKMTITLEFRTTSQRGVLVSSSDGSKFGFTLELDEGKLKLAVINKNGPFRVESNNDKVFFCDNKWHKVTAVLSDNALTLSPEGLGDSRLTSRLPLGDIGLKSPLFVGGFQDSFTQVASSSADNFIGCIRGLVIDGSLVDWYKLILSPNIRKTACPIS